MIDVSIFLISLGFSVSYCLIKITTSFDMDRRFVRITILSPRDREPRIQTIPKRLSNNDEVLNFYNSFNHHSILHRKNPVLREMMLLHERIMEGNNRGYDVSKREVQRISVSNHLMSYFILSDNGEQFY